MTSVLITGASSGLGAGLAREYARSGATVGLLARRVGELERVAREVTALGGTPRCLPVDVGDTRAMREAVQSFAEAAGGLDVVIANAGVGEGLDAERFDPEKVAEVFRVNVIGLSNTLLPAVPLMQARRAGTLVGMSSVAAFRAMPGSLAYSASKAAVTTFMEGLALELGPSGVHAMAICPGFIRTPLTDRNDFPMPFRLECDDACRRMKDAIDRREERFVFPLPFKIAARALQVAPRWLLRAALPTAGFRSAAPASEPGRDEP
jgi:short-subunit dehydrogenase